MTGSVNFRSGFRPVRRDKLIQERVHDTYKTRGKLPEPTVCPECGAVYHKGRWQWLPQPDRPHRQLCPACHRVRDKFPAGYVTLAGGFLTQHRDEILHLVRNQGEQARAEHPLERIIAINDHDGGVLVTTTGIHLARRIGEALEHACHGELEFHYNEAENLLRVHWERGAV
ncbi:MAG: ATPase [Burkholderiales bacterium]|nr:ATPase [Burkholderiales bacterium]